MSRLALKWRRCQLAGAALSLCAGLMALAAEAPAMPVAAGKTAAPAKKAMPPVPVRVATVEQKPMPVEFRTFGSVEAFAEIEIKPQVGGIVSEECVQPGQAVQADAVLFRIDRRPYEAALRQAEAALARDQAQAAEAIRQAELAKELFEKHVGTEDVVKAKQATVATLTAQAALSAAQVDIARLQLGYCEIKAPFAGRISDLRIRRGSVITANSGIFTTLAQTKPVYVTFALPQTRLSELRAEMAKRSLTVTAVPRDLAQAQPVAGTLIFIDNVINDASGTIRLKASFPNADEALWPGQYVNVGLILRDEPQALVVPGAAVQNGQQGTYVFVVNEDKTVTLRPVRIARQAGTLAVVATGLKPGETVVIDGQARLMPGVVVSVLKANEKSKTENPVGTANKRE